MGELEVKPARMSLLMADGSPKRPYGVVENVKLQVDNLMFLVDFVILEMEENTKIPIILGRSFLKTAKVIINVDEGTISLKNQEEEVILSACKTGRKHEENGTNPKAAFQDALGKVNRTAKARKKGKIYFLSQVPKQEKHNKGSIVHQSPLKKQEGLRPGLPVQCNKKLWVIKDFTADGFIEIESPTSRRTKKVNRKMLKIN
ncbi:uncharacterized protein LOC106754341 [Vigna radiata var. radiata]|uniref:Uncharacterized protein LOC106754341 n=1 Tax=Vigna radiata var. radiata TaxID=3916 RepID=A0A1S3TDJ3_VIGRR|nr:uncharacterized protein LOC106754341 [Vigna radiata var. radiata]